jgi:hypothetical protein
VRAAEEDRLMLREVGFQGKFDIAQFPVFDQLV